ncbi:hypothetical protein QLX67_12740, partial [Balneolaceae bacterium ANBcel3]|nr:hypothetical protein [Balneolaceae bacterium ANBcel3]
SMLRNIHTNDKELNRLVKSIIETRKTNENADISELKSEIDKVVYQLYNLTEEEIEIIENN